MRSLHVALPIIPRYRRERLYDRRRARREPRDPNGPCRRENAGRRQAERRSPRRNGDKRSERRSLRHIGSAHSHGALEPLLLATPETNRREAAPSFEIGRASCGERVCPIVSISVVAVSVKNTNTHKYYE